MTLFFVHTETEIGGAERVLLNLLGDDTLRRRSVLALAAKRPGPLFEAARDAGIDVVFTRGARLRHPCGVFSVLERLAKLARARGATVVCAKGTHANVFASTLAFHLDLPAVFIAAMIYSTDPRRADKIDSLALAGKMDFAFANSSACMKTLEQIRPRVPKRVLPLGTPLHLVDDDVAGALRSELGISPREKLVGVFGRLQRWKGQDVFVDAAIELLERHDDTHFILVGDSAFGLEPEFLEGLRARVKGAALESRIRFLGYREDVPALMRACDIVCHTSRMPEPFGMVIIEALAQRRPVIATRGGGPSEILEDGAGVLIAPDDARALSESINTLLVDERSRDRLGARGYERVNARYSVAKMAETFSEVVDTLGAGR